MESIRFIIWDLDDTLWEGTLSEGSVAMSQNNIQLIRDLTDRGIINSICSKNDYEDVRRKLTQYGIWDYFVFPAITWNPKGPEVRDIIDSIKLRPETVLFIDDNSSNLEEVKYYCPGINVASPEIIGTMVESNPLFSGKNDKAHTRLLQYKVLEQKKKDERKFEDNIDFLRHSGINVQIVRNNCKEEIDRISELVQRTNQLNYTKKRDTKEVLLSLIDDENCDTGYVRVQDNYGDYGVVGFFVVKGGELIHFLFSCRTIGLGVEQWVYSQLGFPRIQVMGSVANYLTQGVIPDWINTEEGSSVCLSKHPDTQSAKPKVLILGGCDLEQTAYYLEQEGLDFTSCFNYVTDSNFVCHPEALEIIRGSVEFSDSEKQYIIKNCPFYDNRIFNNPLVSAREEYDYIVFSPLIEMAIGVYECQLHKGLHVVYGNFDSPKQKGLAYMSSSQYEMFSREFSFLGHTRPERFYENLCFLKSLIPNRTRIIIINGSIIPIEHPLEPQREKFHEIMDDVIDRFVSENSNVSLIDMRRIISSERDHTDTIRHYSRRIYYQIAQEILGIVLNDKSCVSTGKRKVTYRKESFRVRIKTLLRRIGLLKVFYRSSDR